MSPYKMYHRCINHNVCKCKTISFYQGACHVVSIVTEILSAMVDNDIDMKFYRRRRGSKSGKYTFYHASNRKFRFSIFLPVYLEKFSYPLIYDASLKFQYHKMHNHQTSNDNESRVVKILHIGKTKYTEILYLHLCYSEIS